MIELNKHKGQLDKTTLSCLSRYFSESLITEEMLVEKLFDIKGTKWNICRIIKPTNDWEGVPKKLFYKKKQLCILLLPTISDYLYMYNDSLLRKFLRFRSVHYKNIIDPIGWVRISLINKNSWVIHELQSDLIMRLKKAIKICPHKIKQQPIFIDDKFEIYEHEFTLFK